MKRLKCASNLRSAAFEFQLFAAGDTPGGQGDSRALGPSRFYINDFLDYLYRIDEFWDVPTSATATMRASKETIMCPAGAVQLTRRAGFPCSRAAIDPAEEVTLGANMRLYRASVEFLGRPVLAPAAATRVRADVLQHPYVPLLMDVDGAKAVAQGLEPFYTAPPLAGDEKSPYADGRYWVPSARHKGYTNVAFVGGHVASSRHPADEQWDWVYQAGVHR
jgi:prepilin-type processing-associated H-X9-DG protein